MAAAPSEIDGENLPERYVEPVPERGESRLVIAIDYGTTYTGVAYATPTGNRAYLNEVDVLQLELGHAQ